TVAWATMTGASSNQIVEGVSPELLADPQAFTQFQDNIHHAAPVMKGMEMMAKKVISPDRVELKVRVETIIEGGDGISVVPMTRVGNSWKLGNGIDDYHVEWE